MSTTVDEDLQTLEIKLKQLKLEYDQYFLGSRPRPPAQLRADVQKLITIYSNRRLQNTSHRFKFSGICSRFMVFRRQWDETLRRIESGTYERHVFRAKLRDGSPVPASKPAQGEARSLGGRELFEAYRDAAQACGQNVRNLTPERLQAVVAKQERQLRERLGCKRVDFRVVVEQGRVKLKASPVRR